MRLTIYPLSLSLTFIHLFIQQILIAQALWQLSLQSTMTQILGRQ